MKITAASWDYHEHTEQNSGNTDGMMTMVVLVKKGQYAQKVCTQTERQTNTIGTSALVMLEEAEKLM